MKDRGHSRTLVVKGNSVLLIMPSRFMAVFPFMAFLSSSSSFLIFLINWSLPCVDCSVCLEVSLSMLFSGLLALLSFWRQLHHARDILLPFGDINCLKSSFYFISYCTLAVNAWICWDITTGSNGEVVVESIGLKELVDRDTMTRCIELQFIVSHRQL